MEKKKTSWFRRHKKQIFIGVLVSTGVIVVVGACYCFSPESLKDSVKQLLLSKMKNKKDPVFQESSISGEFVTDSTSSYPSECNSFSDLEDKAIYFDVEEEDDEDGMEYPTYEECLDNQLFEEDPEQYELLHELINEGECMTDEEYEQKKEMLNEDALIVLSAHEQNVFDRIMDDDSWAWGREEN